HYGKGSGARYGNGVYHIYAGAQGGVESEPEKASSVFPAAPSNILIGVDVRVLPGSPRSHYTYDLSCRSGSSNGYDFEVLFIGSGAEAVITKTSSRHDLDAENITIRQNSDNLLQAQCSNIHDGKGVNLIFLVNGRIVASATDINNPLRTGTVG